MAETIEQPAVVSRDIPVIFSGAMVKALLAGRKTQTRRLASSPLAKAKPGDRLYVRESIWQASPYPGTSPSGEPDESGRWSSHLVHHAADGNPPNCANRYYGPNGLRGGAFAAPDPYAVWLQRPSIHMPRWASRLTLVVEEVRFQRLQDISEADAIAEGAGQYTSQTKILRPFNPDWKGEYRAGFMALWDSLHGPASWDANPAVVALTFSVHRRNIDRLSEGGRDAG